MDGSPLSGISVGVAGATSFLAQSVSRTLAGAGAHIVPIIREGSHVDRLPAYFSGSSPIRISGDDEKLKLDFASAELNVIVNCVGNYGRQGESLADIFSANLLCPIRLFEAAAASGGRLMVSVGTALPPDMSFYALSKNQLVDVLRAASAGKMRFCNLRSEIFYGPGDRDPKKLTSFLTRQIADNAVEIGLGSGRQLRDFIFVDDLASALTAITAEELNARDGFAQYDVGTGQRVSVRMFAEKFKEIAGSDIRLNFGAIPDSHSSSGSIDIDVSKLFALGWTPRWSLERGIAETLAEAGVSTNA